MKEVDVGVEADLIHNFEEATVTDGLEKALEKADKLGDLTSALLDERKSWDPLI